jgi:thioredoxin 2
MNNSSNDLAPTVRCPRCGKVNRVRQAARGVPHCAACGTPLPWVVDADQQGFQAAVEESTLPVLAEFWAGWCGPCKMVAPVVEQMSRELAGRMKVVKIDSDRSPDLSTRFGVRGLPTLMLFDGGQVRDRVTGALGAADLRRWLEAHLPAPQARTS